MRLMQKKSKGMAGTLDAALQALFAIGVIALFVWIFISVILDIITSMAESATERHAMNLANVLISSEKLAYEKDGKISRGILDSTKLDENFIKKSDALADFKLFFEPRNIGIGYPNTLNMVLVIDEEKCQDSECDGWSASLWGPVSLEGLSISKFSTCLEESKSKDVASMVFRGLISGAVGDIWLPFDVEKCNKQTMPEGIKSFFTETPVSSKGFPIIIRYPDGELHAGRIIVGVGEWI